MAREIAVIKQQIIDSKNAQPSLSELNSPSQTAIWNLWAFIIAVSINLFEQLQDVFRAEIEATIEVAGVGTPPWMRAQVLKFQYSATTPQFVQLDTNTLVISYPIINTELQIITRASLVSASGITQVKVAKSEPPQALSPTEVSALESYIAKIQFATKEIFVVSKTADNLIVIGDIYYDGQYASTIKAVVIAALDSYCASLSSVDNFGDDVKLVDVEAAIRAVPGVTDIGLSEVSARADGVAIVDRYKIYDLAAGVNNRVYSNISGYIVQEGTVSYTFEDTLNFIANA